MLPRCAHLRQLACQLTSCLPAAAGDALPSSLNSAFSRYMSNLPTDYLKVKVVMPVRAVKKSETIPQTSASSEQPSTSGAASAPSVNATMRQGAQTGALALLPYACTLSST